MNRIAYRVVRIAYAQISTDKKDTDDYRDSGKFIQISMYFYKFRPDDTSGHISRAQAEYISRAVGEYISL